MAFVSFISPFPTTGHTVKHTLLGKMLQEKAKE
jgi:hypothetical protein